MQPDLLAALNTVGKAVDSRPMIGILSTVHLEATKDEDETPGFRLWATDLELSIRVNVKALSVKVWEPGAICLPFATLRDLVRTMPAERVELELDTVRTGHRVNLKCGKTRATVVGLPADEFPVWPGSADEKPLMRVDAVAYRAALKRVLYAASPKDYRPILASVLHRVHVEGLWLAAADGYRLALDCPGRLDDDGGAGDFPIQRRMLAALLPLLPEAGEISVYATPERNAVRYDLDGVEVVAQLIDGRFPDYEAIIPREYKSRVALDREAFIGALRRALVFARDFNNFVDLELATDEGLRVAARSSERGDAEEWVKALDVQGQGDNAARFNATYWLDALTALDGDTVALELNGPTAPAVMRAEGNDDWLCVVMPVGDAR